MTIREQIEAWPNNEGKCYHYEADLFKDDVAALEARLATATEALRALESHASAAHPPVETRDNICGFCTAIYDARAVLDALDK